MATDLIQEITLKYILTGKEILEERLRIIANPKPRWCPQLLWIWMVSLVLRIEYVR